MIGSEKIVLGLWSIAVMDKLQLEHAKLVLPYLEKYVAARGMQLHEKIVNQFQQVILDIKLKAQQAGEESKKQILPYLIMCIRCVHNVLH